VYLYLCLSVCLFVCPSLCFLLFIWVSCLMQIHTYINKLIDQSMHLYRTTAKYGQCPLPSRLAQKFLLKQNQIQFSARSKTSLSRGRAGDRSHIVIPAEHSNSATLDKTTNKNFIKNWSIKHSPSVCTMDTGHYLRIWKRLLFTGRPA